MDHVTIRRIPSSLCPDHPRSSPPGHCAAPFSCTSALLLPPVASVCAASPSTLVSCTRSVSSTRPPAPDSLLRQFGSDVIWWWCHVTTFILRSRRARSNGALDGLNAPSALLQSTLLCVALGATCLARRVDPFTHLSIAHDVPGLPFLRTRAREPPMNRYIPLVLSSRALRHRWSHNSCGKFRESLARGFVAVSPSRDASQVHPGSSRPPLLAPTLSSMSIRGGATSYANGPHALSAPRAVLLRAAHPPIAGLHTYSFPAPMNSLETVAERARRRPVDASVCIRCLGDDGVNRREGKTSWYEGECRGARPRIVGGEIAFIPCRPCCSDPGWRRACHTADIPSSCRKYQMDDGDIVERSWRADGGRVGSG
ncbi:hypothetical protein B0H14DRAFT_3466009 [Mycena olivaceomarginata]|nr:hypothetical protein B0H14DRAFT_3466009 [Mycena olivaceomarginata]